MSGSAGRGHDVSLRMSENRFMLGSLGERDGGGVGNGFKGELLDMRGLPIDWLRRDGGGGALDMIGCEPAARCEDGGKYERSGNLVDEEVIKTGTFAIGGDLPHNVDPSIDSSASRGGESGRGMEAASSPSCTRLLDTLDFRP